MKKIELTLTSFATISLLAFVIGCGNSQPSATSSPQADAAPSADHADDHGEAGHSHDEHSHGAGPHDGTLADWGGGKYHVEFTVDHDKQEATVYILGGDEKSASSIKTEELQLSIREPAIQVTLKAVPQEGDPTGSASRFVGQHESLGMVQEYTGTITGLVDDTPYSGDFSETPHDH